MSTRDLAGAGIADVADGEDAEPRQFHHHVPRPAALTNVTALTPGLLARQNATDPAAASAASSEKPGTYEPVRSASTPATSGPRIMPNMTIIDDTPAMVPKDALPK